MDLPARNPLTPPAPEDASAEELEARQTTLRAVQTAVAALAGSEDRRDGSAAVDHLGSPTVVEVELPSHLVEAVGHLAQRAGVSPENWLTATLVWAIADEIDLEHELSDI